MIDITQLTALISAFRVETEKESISPETVGKILQDIADLLATVPSENDFNILRFWKETLQQYRFLYDIQQRNVEDHSNVILSLMARSLLDGAASSLTLAIGPASATRAGVLTAEDFLKLQNLGSYTDDLVDSFLELQTTVDTNSAAITRIKAAGFVLQSFQAGSADAARVTFAASRYNLSTGAAAMLNNALVIEAATDQKAGVMTAQHVIALSAAKTDINALKAAMQKVQGSGALVDDIRQYYTGADRLGFEVVGYNVATGEQNVSLKRILLSGADTQTAGLMTSAMVAQLNQLRQAVFGSGGSTAQSRSFYNIGIEINKGSGALFVRGAEELIDKGYTPYLFRYSRKRNRVNVDGERYHGPVRKGWNALGKDDTVTIGTDGQVLIDAKVIDRTYENGEKYRHEARYFVKDATDKDGNRKASFGKIRIMVAEKQGKTLVPRKVRLQYGIAFAKVKTGNRQLLDKTDLVTPIVPFHVSTRVNNGSYDWIFER
mgnify:CR=1 FL=1